MLQDRRALSARHARPDSAIRIKSFDLNPRITECPSRAQFPSAFMLSDSHLKTMLDLARRAALPIEAGATGEAILSAEAVSRRLVAIIAADVAGYSRLMEAEEEGTLARLRSLRHDLIDPKVTLHKGRTLKTTGDGMLIESANVVQAVRIAAG
jgi:class 3 adenylate cyclase